MGKLDEEEIMEEGHISKRSKDSNLNTDRQKNQDKKSEEKKNGEEKNKKRWFKTRSEYFENLDNLKKNYDKIQHFLEIP
jgi:hypothetical protein